MRYAIDRRTKRVVQADKIRGTERNRAYECPVCEAEVHYRRAMGLSPDPGFAHNAHLAREDCELYHPSLGGEISGSWTKTIAASNEFDLCLDDQENWSLFLRFPEIPDLGNARLRALTTGSISVLAGNASASLPLMELRPGVGSARLVVPPSMNTYQAAPTGQWPADLPSDRWRGTCRGLYPRGTPFVLRHGEWERIREGAEVELGSEIRIVAEARNSPPPMCSLESAAVKPHNKLEWRMWRVFLPDSASPPLDRWADAIEVKLVAPADELSVVGIPHSFSSGGPIFTTGRAFVARVKWAPSEGPSTLSLRTPLGSESSSTWPTQQSAAYVAFTVRDSGATTLTANCDRRTSVTIEAVPGPTISEVHKGLNAAQSLQIFIGNTKVVAWQESVSLRPIAGQADPPQIAISPDYEDLRFDMQWIAADGATYDRGLTAGMVQNRLTASWGQDADFQISAGAFGSIRLRFHRPNRPWSAPSASRAMRWATLAGGRPERGASSWVRRKLAANKNGSLRGRASGTSARWIPLMVNEVKRSEK
jgi:hypothetical protein